MIDVSQYEIVGCPKCGAKHRCFNAHEAVQCCRCLFYFFAVEARLYEEYKKKPGSEGE